jgi:ATP-dependent DNA helicase RecG
MAKTKIFISSVQTEFTQERQSLFEYILSDPLLGRFFEPFLFERLPAIDQRADVVYLNEVQQCNIYLGLLGVHYGFENEDGLSPTELEYDFATQNHKTRFIFLTTHIEDERHPKQNLFINKAQQVLIRKRFSSLEELKSAVYATLVHYLIDKELIRVGPFDTSLHPTATLLDLDEKKVLHFVAIARSKRGFKLDETAPLEEILIHLNLMNEGKLTNASLLLFGNEPQRFFINSEVRCVHFHGTIVEKPIPSYKVFKGDVFQLVDEAVDFVLSKLDYSIGTRAENTSIPGKYEIPKEIIVEAIVNAIAHRDYTNNGSVQVMLFKDRLEVSNPGSIPLGWTIEKLKGLHTSVPANPLLAEPMYLKGYIERLGTGTADIIRIARENNLPEPIFEQHEEFKTTLYRPSTDQVPTKHRPSTDQASEVINEVSVEIKNMVKVVTETLTLQDIQERLGLKHRGNFRANYLEPAIKQGFVSMLFPDTPKRPDQQYLLSPKGNELLQILISLEKQVETLPAKNPIVSEGSRNDVGMMSERCRNEFGDTAAAVFIEIVTNPTITIEELSLKIDKSTRTIERTIEKLKLANILVRKGPKLGGYWEIHFE